MKQYSRFILFSAITLLIVFIAQNMNHRFWLSDFSVYFYATQAFLNRGAVYGVGLGEFGGNYKYSPVLLLVFAPSVLFSFSVSSVLHYIVICISAIATVIVLQKILEKVFPEISRGNANLNMGIVLVLVLNHILRELHLGNVNIILLFFCTQAFWYALNSRGIPSGILLGISLLFKPYLLVLALPFAFHKKYRTLLAALGTIVFPVLLMAIFFGFDRIYLLHKQWVNAMLVHSIQQTSHQSISALLQYYFSFPTTLFIQFFMLVCFILFGLVVFYFFKSKQGNEDYQLNRNSYLVFLFFSVLAFIPNLLNTDIGHFVFTLPLVALSFRFLLYQKKSAFLAIFGLLILLYGSNSPELFGSGLSNKIDHMGTIGLANLALILLAAYLFYWQLYKSKALNSVNPA
jgi:hypothetical protein